MGDLLPDFKLEPLKELRRNIKKKTVEEREEQDLLRGFQRRHGRGGQRSKLAGAPVAETGTGEVQEKAARELRKGTPEARLKADRETRGAKGMDEDAVKNLLGGVKRGTAKAGRVLSSDKKPLDDSAVNDLLANHRSKGR